jgi:hypothetical protein
LSLAAYNGSPLPLVIDKLPSIGPDGSRSNCSLSLIAGTLDLTSEQTYDLTLQTQDTCGGTPHFATADTGSYLRIRDSLTFHPGGAGQLTYWGEAAATKVRMHYSGSVLDFVL